MEHSEATEAMASARYLLGEMSGDEREAFEEHFFGCSECARDVRAGSAMIDSIRAEKPQVSRMRPVQSLGWILSAAAIAAVVFLGVQNAALRRASEPRILPSYSMLTIGSRAAAQPTTIDDRTKPFALYIDIPPQPSSSSYRIEIRDSVNSTKVSLPVSAERARDTITVYVPPNRLESGKYNVAILAADGSTIGSGALEVR
jgi:hypothetical protein